MRICNRFAHRLGITAITIALQAGCWFVAAQKASFVIPPQSVNISLNEVAEINCTAMATFISWEVNGQTLDTDIRKKGFDDSAPSVTLNETQDLRMRTLRVVGSPDSNGANITCNVLLQIDTTFVGNKSEPALILVQGLLGAVHNLTVTTINLTTVLISWSPPFTLEGVPIQGYNVTITNTTSGENETVSVEATTLLYSIDHPDPQNGFTVTVVPLNEVGSGDPVTSVDTPHTTTSSWTVISTFNTVTPTLSLSTTTASTTPVTVVVLAVVTSCVVITSLGLLATTCFLAREHRITRLGTTAQDTVMVSDNPACERTTVQRIELKENTAYHTVHPAAASPQYENVSQFRILDEDNVGSRKRESPDYEVVPD